MSRMYGLDLFRLTAMLMITVLHFNNQHLGLLDSNRPLSHYVFGVTVEYACFCGVNCFAILSGFLLKKSDDFYGEKWFARIMNLWIKMIFWGIGIYLAASWFFPNTKFSWSELIKFFFPIMEITWWYINAYLGLLVFLPLLNKGIGKCSSQEQFWLSLSLFLMFSIFPVASFSVGKGAFALHGGYSTIWLMICFIWGCILKDNIEIILQRRRLNLFLIGGVVAAIGIPVAFHLSGFRLHGIFMSYLSPFCILEAVCLFILFYQIRINGCRIRKIIVSLSSNALGIYLLQAHPLIWNNFIIVRPLETLTLPQYAALLAILSLLLGSVGILLNVIIERIYSFCRMPSFVVWMYHAVAAVFH